MLYDYECSKCGYFMIDVHQSINDQPLSICPSCGSTSLSRIIYGGLGAFVKDVKTIGQLADNNWRKMGHYEKSDKLALNKEQSVKSESIFSSTNKATRQEINKMSEDQKKKYIITGDK